MLVIEQPGLLSTVQDSGRPGYGRQGIGQSGAADLPALQLANALVGNSINQAALEFSLIGPSLSFSRDSLFALTGAPLPNVQLNGQPIQGWRTLFAPAGSQLNCGPMSAGCRSYLAVNGGIALPSWLGSQSSDINAGLGPLPRPLQSGDQLPLGTPSLKLKQDCNWQLSARFWFRPRPRPLRLIACGHSQLLCPQSLLALSQHSFRISPDSNRTGIRLQGPALELQQPIELLSSGLMPGCMQLPPNGQPILMGPEHPVTGGYPRIAQLAAVDLPALAQYRPGDSIRFVWIELEQALSLQQRQQQGLRQLIQSIQQRLNA